MAAQAHVDGVELDVRCAQVKAPLSWSDLSLGSITVQVTKSARRPDAGDTRATRTLFVNPGGPGAPADWITPYVSWLEPDLRKLHDVVGVDPRGTGGSTPLACELYGDGVRDYRNPSQATIAAQQNAAKRTVADCVAKNGTYLRQITTANTVRDLDLVRALLGRDKIDFLGVSAGTWLGAHYAQTFPTRVGRFVLDSNTRFAGGWRDSFALQPHGFQRRFEDQFLGWAARRHDRYGLGTTKARVLATYQTVRADAAAGALPLTPNQLDMGLAVSMYADTQFYEAASLLENVRDLAQINRRARSAPGRAVPRAELQRAQIAARAITRMVGSVRRAGPSAADTVFMAIQCNDTAWSRSPQSYVTEGLTLGKRNWLIGYGWVSSYCAYWPWTPAPSVPITGRGIPEMLMVQTELDPATPWEGASFTERMTAGTRLLAVDNQGNHAAYIGDNSCVERAVSNYLTQGALPPRNRVCAAVRLPEDDRVWAVGTRVPRGRPAQSTRWPVVRGEAAAAARKEAARRIADSLRLR